MSATRKSPLRDGKQVAGIYKVLKQLYGGNQIVFPNGKTEHQIAIEVPCKISCLWESSLGYISIDPGESRKALLP